MTYDSTRQTSVLYGGAVGSNETWEIGGTGWTLRATSGPRPLSDLALAFDSSRGATVLFGGRDFNTYVN
jgi:hypothetical protein